MKSIGKRMRAARKLLRLTQDQMARKLRCCQATISLAERTGKIPFTRDVPRFAAAYGLSAADLTPSTKRRAA